MPTMLTSYVRPPGPRPVDGIGEDSADFSAGFADGYQGATAQGVTMDYLRAFRMGREAAQTRRVVDAERRAVLMAEHPQVERMRGQR